MTCVLVTNTASIPHKDTQGGGGNFLCESGWKKGGGSTMHAGQKGFGWDRDWDNGVARGQCKHTHSTLQTGYHTV